MKNLVVIGLDGIIRGHIGNVDLPARKPFLPAMLQRATAAHESGVGADDVQFVEVTDTDDAAFQLREISIGFKWDPDNKRGIPDQATLDARDQADADIAAESDARAVVDNLTDIARGDFSGTAPDALRVLARAVRFLVVRELRGQ